MIILADNCLLQGVSLLGRPTLYFVPKRCSFKIKDRFCAIGQGIFPPVIGWRLACAVSTSSFDWWVEIWSAVKAACLTNYWYKPFWALNPWRLRGKHVDSKYHGAQIWLSHSEVVSNSTSTNPLNKLQFSYIVSRLFNFRPKAACIFAA